MEIEKVARELSPYMRLVLDRVWRGGDRGISNKDIRWPTLNALRGRGLCFGYSCRDGYRERITTLGSAVRRHLQEQAQ